MLTDAQIPTLRTAIQNETDPAFVTLRNAGATGDMAAFFNQDASPEYWVWRTRVMKRELVTSVGPEGTTFNWTGTGFITRSVGERDAWRELFDGSGSVNPSLDNVRTAFGDIFSGATAPAPANRTHLLAVSRRKATRGEKLFATGTGSTASPAKLGFEGEVTNDDVVRAVNS